MAQWVKNLPEMQETQETDSIPESGRSLVEGNKKQQPTPVFLPEISHGQRSLVGYSPEASKELYITGHAYI